MRIAAVVLRLTLLAFAATLGAAARAPRRTPAAAAAAGFFCAVLRRLKMISSSDKSRGGGAAAPRAKPRLAGATKSAIRAASNECNDFF